MICANFDGSYYCSFGNDFSRVINCQKGGAFTLPTIKESNCLELIVKYSMPKAYQMFKEEFSRDSRATFCMWRDSRGVWRAES